MTKPSDNQIGIAPPNYEELSLFQACRGSVGCSFVAGLIVFLIAFAIVAALSSFNWAAILGIAPLVGGMVFIAMLILSVRDNVIQYYTRRAVRNLLLAESDADDKEFIHRYPDVPSELMREIRESMAIFFNVPMGRIRAHHDLVHDLRMPFYTPYLGFYAIGRAFESRGIETNAVIEWDMNVKDFNDFAEQVAKAITVAKTAPVESPTKKA